MKQQKTFILNFIKMIYLVVVFAVACFCFSVFLSQGDVDLTTEMSDARLPVIHINVGDIGVNYLYGYTGEMECSYMRDSLTIVDSDRTIDYTVDTYGANIDSMLFEVRSVDGSRLVERTDLNIYSKQNETIRGSFTIKDLITNGDEYMLIFVVSLDDGTEAKYYTRLMWSENLHVDEKIAFVYDFSDRTFDKNRAAEITKYLESNASGDNSSFQHVDIHSSFNQVTWGDLDIIRIGEPRITISELTAATGYFKVNYQVGIQEESGRATCNVTEYFRIRYTTDRIYLLSWERICNQIPNETAKIYSGDQIELGIAPINLEMLESDDGNNFAFVDEGKLIAVNGAEQKVALLHSFYAEDISDLRASHREHDYRILSVDEAGNVIFMVFGYMNRGKHEGRVGVCIYRYNSAMNTTEEIAYVDYSRSASILMEDIDELSYIDRDGNVYFMLERNVYEVNVENLSLTTVATSLKDDSYKVSQSGRILVWQADGEDIYSCERLRLMNLSSGISEDLKAGYGEYIMPLGFMGEDLVYGCARSREVVMDVDGTTIFPMYKVIIRNTEGEILKEYSEDNVYVMSADFRLDLVDMERTEYNSSTNKYEPIQNDQIVSTTEGIGKDNTIVPIVIDTLETVAQISMKQELVEGERINLTPREILFEGDRIISKPEVDTTDYYYVYGLHGYIGSYLEVSNAVNEAYGISGIVMDGNGQYIWYKTTRYNRNQIMAITEPTQTTADDSLANCVDTMLRFEGVTTNSRILLSQGQSVLQILTDYMSDNTVLNLSGCNLDAVLYYVNQDIPVLAIMNDYSAVLLTGFNDSQVVLYDPTAGELHKESITDTDNTFRANGYKFITYVR